MKGIIRKRAVWQDKATGEQHGILVSNYSDGLKRFAKARRF